MQTIVPERSLDQKMEALLKANHHRTARADWKKDVKHGRVNPLDVLTVPPAEFETMKVFDALMALPKHGRVKTNKVLQHARVSPSKTLGGMTARQRAEIVSLLGWRR